MRPDNSVVVSDRRTCERHEKLHSELMFLVIWEQLVPMRGRTNRRDIWEQYQRPRASVKSISLLRVRTAARLRSARRPRIALSSHVYPVPASSGWLRWITASSAPGSKEENRFEVSERCSSSSLIPVKSQNTKWRIVCETRRLFRRNSSPLGRPPGLLKVFFFFPSKQTSVTLRNLLPIKIDWKHPGKHCTANIITTSLSKTNKCSDHMELFEFITSI